jgi:hypothetical protein
MELGHEDLYSFFWWEMQTALNKKHYPGSLKRSKNKRIDVLQDRHEYLPPVGW